MNKKLFDVLELVLKEIRENVVGEVQLQTIIDMLYEHGFSDDEISLAMSWLLSSGDNLQQLVGSAPEGLPRPLWRNLNDEEREAISPSAYSFLFHLRELELLSDNKMEQVIDRAVRLNTSYLGVEDMKELITAVVLDYEDNASSGYFQFLSTSSPQ